MLHINDLSYRIEGRPIFEGATAGIPTGHKVGLVGRNGAGKSSLLFAMAGFPEQSGGSVTDGDVRLVTSAGDVDLTRMSIGARSEHGVTLVPAEDKVFADLSVRDHLREALGAGARRTSGSPALTMAELLAAFPALEGKLDRRAGLLSGGERQQLADVFAVAVEQLLCARMITSAALVRKESLGSHWRSDARTSSAWSGRHSVVTLTPGPEPRIVAEFDAERPRRPYPGARTHSSTESSSVRAR